ncbi:hypothetical protein TVAG_253090 [Trichomonas vaginalis G3]|uniref:Uncharacterized protein n=1 Tax=Trichomonas vaginalis (strain ATCC PRA-98 / G3) TaxID=412133 RepID=A2EXG8_TRIV3|nr:hypothetical protein TVAG_253090 [Trichomonas vaginalis G3]|eukprot:XP_001314881.1 hypothetical protein [Trichomonas vaginalis G3]
MQGEVKFNSYSTRFVNFNGNNWVHIGDPTRYTEQVYETLNGGINGCSGEDPIIRQINFNNASQVNEGQDSTTSQILSPTAYTYVATAITKLPFQTTSSYVIQSPKNDKLEVNSKTRSIAPTATPTPLNTPHTTPHSTAQTTPTGTVPPQSPARTPFATFSKPIQGETPIPTVNPMLTETISSTFSLISTNYMSVSYASVETIVGTTPTSILVKAITNCLTTHENTVTFAQSETYTYSVTQYSNETTTTLIFPVYKSTSGETITNVEVHTYSQASTYSFVRGGLISKMLSEWTKTSSGYSITVTELLPNSNTQTFLTYLSSQTLTYKKDKFLSELYNKVKENPLIPGPIIPVVDFFSNIGKYLSSINDNDFNEIAQKNKPELTMVDTSVLTYTSTVIERKITVSTYTSITSGNFIVSLIEKIEKVAENGFSLVPISEIQKPFTEVISKLKPPVDLYKEVSTVSLTETVVKTSGQSYFSGYMSYDTDTFILAYVPTETFCSSFVSGVYTYTASTTLTQTYSFVSESQVIISYIPIQTEFETKTNTLTETKYRVSKGVFSTNLNTANRNKQVTYI